MSSIASLRFPYRRILLPRTRLAYVHLHNLLTDAKRDRAARISGYVAIWMPEELVILYLLRGEVATATVRDAQGARPLAIASALAMVPHEPEYGEICFHEADEDQLSCMYATHTASSEEWPAGMTASDPAALFPYLMATTFDGMIEIIANENANYLTFKNGSVARAFLGSAHQGSVVDRVAKLFARDGRAGELRITRWSTPAELPVQAPHALVQAYRELAATLVDKLVDHGRNGAPELAEQARQTLSVSHAALDGFSFSGKSVTNGRLAHIDGGCRRVDSRSDVDRTRPRGMPAGSAAERAHLGAAAHVSIRWSIRRDPLEGDVSEPDAIDADDPGIDARKTGTLYVVSTPIGNMGDFSFRAVEVLKSVNAVLAEDTRHSRHLLDRYDVGTPLISYHEHNEAKMTPQIVARLGGGESFALISDAGTPLLSDPGARLVRAVADAELSVVPIPGASALLAALVASALDVARFTFFGFLTRSGGARRSELDEISRSGHTVVFYESPNRLADTLGELEQRTSGARMVVVAREMTKQFEEVRRGTLSQLSAYYRDKPPRGELVVLIGAALPEAPSEDVVRERVRALRASGLSARDAAAAVATELGVSKNVAYRLAQEGKNASG